MLQYTSGSTGTPPRCHGHAPEPSLSAPLHAGGRRRTDAVAVSWLPMYHDLGLIAGVLTPFYCGRRLVLMSPLAFVQSPAHWLKAISRYRGNISGAPNFAYDLCSAKFSPADGQGLDLSSLRIMLTGGEPVHRHHRPLHRYFRPLWSAIRCLASLLRFGGKPLSE